MKQDKTYTLEELNAFLDAIEFIQQENDQDDWAPTPSQWRHIRTAIRTLRVVPLLPPPQATPFTPHMYPAPIFSGLAAAGAPTTSANQPPVIGPGFGPVTPNPFGSAGTLTPPSSGADYSSPFA